MGFFPPTPTSSPGDSPRAGIIFPERTEFPQSAALALAALLPPPDTESFYRGYSQALQDMYTQQSYFQTEEIPPAQQGPEPYSATPPPTKAQKDTPQRTRTYHLSRNILTRLLTRLTRKETHLETQSRDEETKGQSRAKMDFKINIHLLTLFKDISPTLSLSLEDQDFPEALEKYKNFRIQSKRIKGIHSGDLHPLLSELRERRNHMDNFLLPLMAKKNKYMFDRIYKQRITLNQFIKNIEKTGIPEDQEIKIKECLRKIDEAKQEFMSKIATPKHVPSWRDSVFPGQYALLTDGFDEDPQNASNPTASSSTESTTASSTPSKHHLHITEKVKGLRESLSESRTHLIGLKSNLTSYMNYVIKREELKPILSELQLSQIEEIGPSPIQFDTIDHYLKEINDLNLQLQTQHRASQQGNPSTIKEVKKLIKAVTQLQERLQQDIDPKQKQLVEHHIRIQEHHETLFKEIAEKLDTPKNSKNPLEGDPLKKYLSVVDRLTIPLDKKNKMKHHINRLLQPKLVITEQRTDNKKQRGTPKLSQQAIFKAAFDGKLEKLQKVRITKDNINETSDYRFTLIHVAAMSEQLTVMDHLLKIDGINVDLPNNNGDSPLISAIKRGHNKAAERLIQSGADTTQKDRNGHTPLHLAVHSGNVNMTKVLLESPLTKDNIPYSDLLEIATNDGYIEMMQFLLDFQKEQDTGTSDSHYQKLLEIAIKNGDLEMLHYLLGLKDEQNTSIPIMSALLEDAIDKENLEIAKALLDAGADPNWVNSRKLTPLARAIIKHDEQMITLLLDNGGNPNQLIRNDQNLPVDTPLSIALRSSHSDKKKSIVLQLCLAGANPDQRLRDKTDLLRDTTPFLMATRINNEDLITLLREFKTVTQKTFWRFGFSCASRSRYGSVA